jgi:hypothetical protein
MTSDPAGVPDVDRVTTPSFVLLEATSPMPAMRGRLLALVREPAVAEDL